MHLNWEPASWRAWGSRPLRVAGYSERWRLEPLCTGGKRPGMLASAWMWAAGVKPGHPGPHGPAGTSQTPASQTSAQPKGGDTDYLSEVPGVSRKEASGRRGPGTTRSEASAPGPRRGVETGGPRATGMAVQAPVDARSVSGSPGRSRGLLPGGSMQGPSRGAKAGPSGASKCPAHLERCCGPSPGAALARGPSLGRSSPEAALPGAVLSPR